MVQIITHLLVIVGITFYATNSWSEIVLPKSPTQNNQLKEAEEKKPQSESFLIFQVIKEQMVLDESNIKNAAIIEQGGKFIGLKVELKAPFINEIERISTNGMGKPANLVFNKKVVSTSVIQTQLGGVLLITGISKEEAQTFLKAITLQSKLLHQTF